MGDIQNTEGRDPAEEAAFLYLQYRFNCDPIYEPCGRYCFPDFSIKENIICEVLSLDGLEEIEGQKIQIRQYATPLMKSCKNTLQRQLAKRKFNSENTFEVELEFSPVAQAIKDEVRRCFADWLRDFLENPKVINSASPICEGVRLKTMRHGKSPNPSIHLTPSFPFGWLHVEVSSLISYALEKKSPKLKSFTGGYEKAILAVFGGPAQLVLPTSLPQTKQAWQKYGWDEFVILRGRPEGALCLSLKS